MSRIWIVRHGNTFEPGEAPRRIGAQTDLPLVESGRVQARALAQCFARDGIRFDRVLSSPLRRTWETAETIADGMPIEAARFLAEIDHGPDENHSETEVVARIGEDALEAWDREAAPPFGWIVDAPARIAGWRTLMDEADDDETILAVTSNGAARFLFRTGLVSIGDTSSLKLRTGAWGLITRDATGRWSLVEWDRRP